MVALDDHLYINAPGDVACGILDGPPANAVYKFGSFDDAEDVEEYRPGGFHPVHLGDRLSDERYHVLHKLGNGGFATVWLCRDTKTKKLVALKIIMADESKHDCPDLKIQEWLAAKKSKASSSPLLAVPTDHFWVDGPNGHHLCLVLPLLGPQIDQVWNKLEDPQKSLPKIALQAAQGLQLLHELGICHGDFRPANILLRLSRLDEVEDDSLLRLLKEPEQDPVILADGSLPGLGAPKYVVRPLNFGNLDTNLLTNDACLIDFGESFHVTIPPSDLGIPASYSSPELLFEHDVGQPSDLWALACTIFEIITGKKLFPDMFGDEEDVILQWVQVLGRMPDPWWGLWETRETFFDDEGKPIDTGGEAHGAQKVTLEECIAESLTVKDATSGVSTTLEVPALARNTCGLTFKSTAV